MKKTVFLTALMLVAGSTQAANFAVITSPPTALSLVVLVGAIVCLAGAYQISAILKGGFLAKTWHLFIGSFFALALSQVGVLLHDFEIYPVPAFAVPAFMLLALVLFIYGIFETKRTLE